MTIAATRMYRSQIDFASGSTEMYDIFSSYFHAQCCLCCFRTLENPQLSSLVILKTKQTDLAPTTLDQTEIKVTVNRAYEQCLTGGLKNGGDSSAVFSTSERILQITAIWKSW